MFNKLFKTAAFLLVFVAAYSYSAEVYCEPKLQPYYNKIMQVPEARQLVQKTLEGGSFSITVGKQSLSGQFGAYWDLDNRVIAINMGPGRSEGKIICSLVFELHNAAISDKYDHLDNLASRRAIDRESYVQSVERLEYENSHSSRKIADKGISMGVFPQDVRRNVYSSFEEHYHWQKYGGHSAWIANTYDQLAG